MHQFLQSTLLAFTLLNKQRKTQKNTLEKGYKFLFENDCHDDYCRPIHAVNNSGRHLEFLIYDVNRGKIIHAAKMATKDESSVDVDFAVCSYKKDCFYFISRGLFSLYNVFMGMLS